MSNAILRCTECWNCGHEFEDGEERLRVSDESWCEPCFDEMDRFAGEYDDDEYEWERGDEFPTEPERDWEYDY